MLLEVLTLPLLALSQPVGLSPTQSRASTTPPPGTVLIKGGRTKVGSTVKEIEELGERDDKVFRITAVETPQHEVNVDDFFLMVNAVTNEQYLAFVRATGAIVPEMWAEATIDEQQRLFLETQAKKIQEAKEAGRVAPERETFVRSEFWRRNGKNFPVEGKDWSMPPEVATRPVVYVDYQAAESYARWAGLRLMSEFEYQRAGRGNGTNLYPWGDEFDPAKAASIGMKLQQPVVVGSLPAGATEAGVFELSGNVWEWTSSPFMPYPRYKELTLEIGRGKSGRKIIGSVQWDENARVAVGGSFQSSEIAARLTTRRNTDRYQSTDSLGFRCAASVIPGFDMADTVLRQDVPPDLRPPDVKFDITKVTAMDRWQSSPGSQPLTNYAVVEGYDYALFVPVVDLDVSSAKQLDDLSHDAGPVTFGVLSLTRDSATPPLPKGTYFVSYLAKANPNDKPAGAQDTKGMVLPAGQDEGEMGPAVEVISLPDGIDRKRDNLVFYSPDDVAVAAAPVSGMEFTRPKQPAVLIGEGTREVMQPNAREELVPVDVPCDQLIFNLNTWVRVSNKGFNYNLVLKFDKGSLGDGWRR